MGNLCRSTLAPGLRHAEERLGVARIPPQVDSGVHDVIFAIRPLRPALRPPPRESYLRSYMLPYEALRRLHLLPGHLYTLRRQHLEQLTLHFRCDREIRFDVRVRTHVVEGVPVDD